MVSQPCFHHPQVHNWFILLWRPWGSNFTLIYRSAKLIFHLQSSPVWPWLDWEKWVVNSARFRTRGGLWSPSEDREKIIISLYQQRRQGEGTGAATERQARQTRHGLNVEHFWLVRYYIRTVNNTISLQKVSQFEERDIRYDWWHILFSNQAFISSQLASVN